MKRILHFMFSLLLLFSCEEKPHDIVEPLTRYAMLNKSGVTVAVVPKGKFSNIPDSLVLENDYSYFWSVHDSGPISKTYDPIYIYFNESVVVYYSSYPGTIRDPRQWGYTDKLSKDGLEYRVYTFTQEDYKRAVEQNNAKR